MRTCRTCGNPEEPHNFRHPFVSTEDPYSKDGLGPSQKQREEGKTPPLPLDPVLRIALLDKGILTADDLAAASKKAAVTQQGVVIASGNQGWGN